MRFKADMMMLLAALVWGIAFAVQRVAASSIGVFLFNGLRFLLAVLVLLPFVRFRPQIERSKLPWVALTGTVLFAASAFQQAGLASTTAGNAGFITGLYVVLIPLIASFILKQKLRWTTWVAALLATAGAFFLSTGGEIRLVKGDLLELVGALLWAIHVFLVSKMARSMNVFAFQIGQCIVCGLLNLATGMVVDMQTIGGVLPGWWAIAYTGIFSVGVGYTLQSFGQRHSPPSDAAIVLSMEAVFATLAGFVFLKESLVPIQLFGCALILGAMLLAQLLPTTEGKKVETAGAVERVET